MAAIKIFVVVALVCCCGTMVLSTDVEEARRRMDAEDANMHPLHIAPAVKKLDSERVRMREMDARDEAMHPKRPREEVIDPAQRRRSREMDDAVMHPKRSKSARTPVKKPDVRVVDVAPDRMKMRDVDDREARMHPQVSNLKKKVFINTIIMFRKMNNKIQLGPRNLVCYIRYFVISGQAINNTKQRKLIHWDRRNLFVISGNLLYQA